MKSPAPYAPPRRLAANKKQFRLQLRRSKPPVEEEPGAERKSHFWKWVAVVALLHLLLLMLFLWSYRSGTKLPPPEQFINLVPEGDVVKGQPGQQEAPKVGLTTPAPAKQHYTPAPQPPPVAIKPPPTPQPAPPKPIAKALPPDKPIVKPTPPKPKVKVDISHDQLVDNETPDKPVKPKPVKPKKHVTTATTDDAHDSESAPDNTGLSAAQVAKMLGDKVNASGIKNSEKIGPSGAPNSKANPFADFYLSVRDQVMNRWENPNLDDTNAVNPVVQIHVEPDGTVPADSVALIQSSGNQTYDDSALAAARGLGHLLQPLPEGCPPDISIHFKLTR
jgi:TonB family protein